MFYIRYTAVDRLQISNINNSFDYITLRNLDSYIAD